LKKNSKSYIIKAGFKPAFNFLQGGGTLASLFELPITHIKGIGENTAQLFHKLGVYSVGQLLCYYPRTYEDWSNPVPITPFLEGNVLIKARLSAPFITSRLTAGRFISKAQISDDSGSVELIYFNNKYISSMLKEGEEYYFFGKVERDLSGLKMIAPTFSPVGNALGLHPVYSLTAGLTNKNVQRFMKEAIKLLPEVQTTWALYLTNIGKSTPEESCLSTENASLLYA